VRVTTIEELLRRLALQDERVVDEALALRPGVSGQPLLPRKAQGLARLSALIAMDAPVVSYQATVIDALAAGTTATEIVGALVAVAPLVGAARVASAAPAIAAALGYDLDDAFERLDGLANDSA
jgi:4-carboxymuconolactone decarboxylase